MLLVSRFPKCNFTPGPDLQGGPPPRPLSPFQCTEVKYKENGKYLV